MKYIPLFHNSFYNTCCNISTTDLVEEIQGNASAVSERDSVDSADTVVKSRRHSSCSKKKIPAGNKRAADRLVSLQ